ncbi:MAG: TetR/AcrR family transcriptional regulator [Lentisphaerae bacterium]|nr:MAG: TetR/AcrR family transcriptional regulator [Lentisphaerota bacterium]
MKSSDPSNKRQLILDALEELISSKRFHEITLDQVAERAKVGKGTIYRYFRDKEDLFLQLAISGMENLNSMIQTRILDNHCAAIEERLLQLCQLLAAFISRRHELMRIVHEEEMRHIHDSMHHGELAQQRHQVMVNIAKIITQGKKTGQLRADLDPFEAAILLHGMLMARHMHMHHHGHGEIALESVITLFLHGARAREEIG